MFREKPRLLLVQPDDIADEKVVRAIVARIRRRFGRLPGFSQDLAVRFH